MSWYRNHDGKIITDAEFNQGCCECSIFTCVPCDRETTDCLYFKKVDTSDYDKEIRDKTIEEFAKQIKDWQDDIYDNERNPVMYDFIFDRIYEIAEEMKGE